MTFKVIPIPAEVAEAARTSGHAPHFGHPTHLHRASSQGYGPCRLCLRRTAVGEQRVLFTYNPTRGGAGIPFGGPVVIHLEPCQPFSGEGLPEGWKGIPMAVCGHLRQGKGLVFRTEMEGGLEAAILETLRDPEVAFITLRNMDPDSACYIARVERLEEGAHAARAGA